MVSMRPVILTPFARNSKGGSNGNKKTLFARGVCITNRANANWKTISKPANPMFFSKPSLDVDEEGRAWLEQSLLRFIQMFGREYFLSRRTILPKPEFFPDRFAPTEEALGKLIARVCGYMDVDFNRIDFHVFSEHEGDAIKEHFSSWEGKSSGAAGKYFGKDGESEKFHIGIEKEKLREPMGLVATIAHELGHVVLLGGGKISRDDKDHEQLTDLVTVFLGMGIFTANAAFQFGQWQGSHRYGWQSSRLGYLSQSMFGYALAACAWMRGEKKVPWESLLTANVKDMFRKTLKYLNNGGATLLAR